MSEEIIKLQNAAIELATQEIEAWTIEKKALKQEIATLKAEVERLTEENRTLEFSCGQWRKLAQESELKNLKESLQPKAEEKV